MLNRREKKSIESQESPMSPVTWQEWQPVNQRSPQSVESRETHYKNIVHLWEFLLELLANETCKSIITWSNANRQEFKITDTEELGKRWGAFKKIKQMNYEKLSRALRYYYKKGIIQKVRNQRLVYRFHKLPYKYEPGVTRSRYHGRRIDACLGRKESGLTGSRHDGNASDRQRDSDVTGSRRDGHKINALIKQQEIGVTSSLLRQAHSARQLKDDEWPSAFTSVTTTIKGRQPLSPFMPTPLHSTLWYPCVMNHTSLPVVSKTRRNAHPITMETTTPGFEPVKPVARACPDIPVPTSSASSIRVSVIRRT